MKQFLLLIILLGCGAQNTVFSQENIRIREKDRRRDIKLKTSEGTIILRLSDSTPLHRDNFLKLVKSDYYKGVLFHRVIRDFMIQAGDPNSKKAGAGAPLGNGGPDYTLPAEFRPSLYHRKGVLAAAREGDATNPEKRSSGSQFYIVQGKKFTEAGLDSVETYRLKGRKLPADQRDTYKTIGGSPHLDQNYTVFGEVVKGIEVVDKIAMVPTSKGADRDRPLKDVRIKKARLVRRK